MAGQAGRKFMNRKSGARLYNHDDHQPGARSQCLRRAPGPCLCLCS